MSSSALTTLDRGIALKLFVVRVLVVGIAQLAPLPAEVG